MVRSGFHRTSVGRVILLIPQKSLGFQEMKSFCHFCRGKHTRKSKMSGGSEESVYEEETHQEDPDIRNKRLVDLSLKTSRE